MTPIERLNIKPLREDRIEFAKEWAGWAGRILLVTIAALAFFAGGMVLAADPIGRAAYDAANRERALW